MNDSMDEKTIHEKVEVFLQRLEDELDKQNLSVPQFAKKMGVPKVTVYAWLNRENIMSLEKYYLALEALGLDEELKPRTQSQGSEMANTPNS